MSKSFNVANYSFVIQVADTKGKHVEFQRIDQVVANINHRREIERVCNQVQGRLNQLNLRLGLQYFIIAEGPSGEIDRILAEQRMEVA